MVVFGSRYFKSGFRFRAEISCIPAASTPTQTAFPPQDLQTGAVRADGPPGTHHQPPQSTADTRIHTGVAGASCSKSARVSRGPALAGGQIGPVLVGSAGGRAPMVAQGQAGAGPPGTYWKSACSGQALATKTQLQCTQLHASHNFVVSEPTLSRRGTLDVFTSICDLPP